MKKVFLLILIMLSIVVTACLKENVRDSAINALAEINTDRNYKTSEINITPADNNKGNTKKIEFEYINNLKEMKVTNLNISDNSNTILTLPTGWHANKAIYKTADSFQFNEQKNKGIKKLYSYEICDDKNSKLGLFEFLGNGGGGLSLPNHCSVEKVIYDGTTKLGAGVIYLLKRDLPKEERTDKYMTFQQIYSVIPIKNEILAFNISINVPFGEQENKYLQIMKDMLIQN